MSQGQSILFVVDPLDALKAYKDSSVAMMRELAARGHDVWATTLPDLLWTDGEVRASAQLLKISRDNKHWYQIEEEAVQPLASFDAVLMRKDPPFDSEYLYATYLLEAAQRQGARVFNDPRALRDHNEKFAITEFAHLAAPTLISRAPEAIRRFHSEHRDIVVKPLDGMGGTSVFRLKPDDPNLNVILETITHLGTRTVMAQRYLPAIKDGDKRVLLIGGRPAPYVLARIPKPGESRGNLAAGGTGRAQPLSEADRRIAEALGPTLADRGLLLVGLDVIGENLTEINVTSPTCFVEIAEQTGFNVAGMFVDALEKELR
jgi:glutathione synthase